MIFRRLRNYLHLGILVAGTSLGCSDSVSRNSLTDMLAEDNSIMVNDGGKSDVSNDGFVGKCEEWTRTYNGSANLDDEGHGIAADSEGNLYLAGQTWDSDNDSDLLILKLDPSGEELRRQTYAGNYTLRNEESGNGVAVGPNNNVSVVGTLYVEGESANIFVLTMDSDGNGIWTWMHNGRANRSDIGSGIAVDYEGNVAVTGAEMDNTESSRIWIRGYDPTNGNILWTRTYQGSYANGTNIGRDIDVDSDGNWYVAGHIDNSMQDPWDIYLGKFDRNGNEILVREYHSGSFEQGFGIAVDREENILLTGIKYLAPSGGSLTQKRNPNGDELWTILSDHYSQAQNFGIVVDSVGNSYVAGSDNLKSSLQGTDIVTTSYDPDGNTRWIRRFNGKNNGKDVGYGIAIRNNILFVVGTEEVNNQQDVWVGKYCLD